jgi:hypothetical protein
VRDPKALEQLVDAPVPGVGDVLADGQVGEEGVLLEYEPHAALLRASIDAPLDVEPDLAVERHATRVGPDQAGDHAQDRGLAGTRRADKGDDALDLERKPQLVRAKTECEVR